MLLQATSWLAVVLAILYTTDGRYADLFGAPGTGVHSIRVCDVAILDYGVAAIGAGCLWWHMGWRGSFWLVYVWVIAAGVLIHEAIGAKTRVNAWLFGRVWPSVVE